MFDFFSFWKSCSIFLEQISFPIAVISLLGILFYYLYFFVKLNFKKDNGTSFSKPISVIVCAKNELNNLKKNLPVLLVQNYFNFEVIVVNDQSSDSSIFFLNELAANHKHLVIVDIDDFVKHTPGKKFALTLGIKTAKHEHVLLTDADCIPNSKDWIKQMSSGFNNADIVLGYGSYQKKNGLLNNIIRFDTFVIAQQYLSFSLAGHTYMGVGRNLGYKKSVFFANKGFASHMHIPSGDDDLFIQEVAPTNTVAIEVSHNAHTSSEVTQSFNDWMFQKRRHISTSPLYKNKFKILLTLYPVFQLLFWLSVLFIFNVDIFCAISFVAIKFIFSYIINYNSMRRLNVFDLYWIHPFYELIHILIQGNFVLLNLFRKPKKWSR